MRSNNIALTYADDTHTDGAGAQLQRIYGIYSLCKALAFTYIHSPVASISYYGLIPVSEPQRRHLLSEYGRVFSIASEGNRNSFPRVVDCPNPTIDDLLALAAEVENGSDRILARLTLPYKIIDAHPEYYHACQAISPFRYNQRGNGPIRVAIHLRRGDLKFVAPDRIIQNSYYIAAALRVSEILASHDLEFVIELHTEVGNEANFPREWFSGPTSAALDFRDNLHEFSVLPNLSIHYDEAPIETITKLATSDILFISKSSFSYLAAILSPSATVFYIPFIHAKMANWVLASEDGAFDEAQFIEKMHSLT